MRRLITVDRSGAISVYLTVRVSAARLSFDGLFRHRGEFARSRSEASETLLVCDDCDRAREGKFKVRSGTASSYGQARDRSTSCADARPRTSSQTGSLGARPPMTSDVTSYAGRALRRHAMLRRHARGM